MSFLNELLGRKNPNMVMQPLYDAVIAEGRRLDWYERGQVPDSLDGRFDMIAAIFCAVLIRLDDTNDARQEIAWLTELFVSDMEGQLRQIGIGDLIVGKRVGEMMGALGGRLGAYKSSLMGEENLSEALTRNLYRGEKPDDEALFFTSENFEKFYIELTKTDTAQIIAGQIGAGSS